MGHLGNVRNPSGLEGVSNSNPNLGRALNLARRSRWNSVLIFALVGSALTASRGLAPSQVIANDTSRTASNVAFDTSGIALVGQDPFQFKPASEAEAGAFDAALNLALANREDMGYPWIDSASKTLRLSLADPLSQEAASLGKASFLDAGLTTSTTKANASVAQLDEIADDITRLQVEGVPHADLIYMTEPDQENNRVIITVSELNSDLMKALASRYGTQLIAVRVRPGGPATAASRDSDAPPFWGGAYIATSTGKACTTGFAWTFPSNQPAMLTAAHCISTGGWVSYPNYTNAGAVQMSSLENWSDTGGTEYYTGQTVYRGDVALIQYSGFGSAATIYSGAPHTSTSSPVAAMNSRWAQSGDAICVNGVVTGEWCGSVNNTGINVWYVLDGLTVVAKHMVQAFSLGNTCPTRGDSGGPVYQKRSDGKVTAFGILSGSAPLVASCYVYFTDIRDPYYGLPGTLKVTG